MASFEELQALAAARSKASQDKLALERAKRETAEKERKIALESKARQDAQREREMLIAREQRRKREEEQRKQNEVERKAKLEQRQKEMKEKEKQGLDVDKFHRASQKAISRAGGSLKPKKSTNGKKKGLEDSVSPPPNMREHSTLTREEKRQRKEAAMLGLVTSSKRKSSSSLHSPHHHHHSTGAKREVDGLVKLGTHKRDTRSVDQIEQDLIASRKARLALQGQGAQRDRIGEEERRERELEVMLRRRKAMDEKRSGGEVRQRDKSFTRSSGSEDDEGERRKRKRERQWESPDEIRNKKAMLLQSSATSRNSFGFNPADFLPGAPIKACLVAKSAPRHDPKSEGRDRKRKEHSKSVVEKLGPPKKETPREKFLREEAERKRLLSRSKRVDSDDDDEDEDEDDDDDEEDDDESDEEEEEEESEEDIPRSSKMSEEIWKMFNRRDKSEYLARDNNSDDDMEADMESLRREEARSARIARLEDQREEAELRRREQEKAKRKAAKGRS